MALIRKHFCKAALEWRGDEGVFPEQACDGWFGFGSLSFQVPGKKQLKNSIINATGFIVEVPRRPEHLLVC